jgi:hypothetical protein
LVGDSFYLLRRNWETGSDLGDILSLRGRRNCQFELLVLFLQLLQERSLRLCGLRLLVLGNMQLFRYELIVPWLVVDLHCSRLTETVRVVEKDFIYITLIIALDLLQSFQ